MPDSNLAEIVEDVAASTDFSGEVDVQEEIYQESLRARAILPRSNANNAKGSADNAREERYSHCVIRAYRRILDALARLSN